MLKERGAEKTGYRGCLIWALVFGLIAAVVTWIYASRYTGDTAPDMPFFIIPVLFASIAFVAGGIVGALLSLSYDFFVRRRETEEDNF